MHAGAMHRDLQESEPLEQESEALGDGTGNLLCSMLLKGCMIIAAL